LRDREGLSITIDACDFTSLGQKSAPVTGAARNIQYLAASELQSPPVSSPMLVLNCAPRPAASHVNAL
jgi:hypothetical protein